MDLIHEFLTTTLTAAGGIVEPMEHGFEGLLPQAVGERFGLPEEFRIRLDEAGEVPGSVDGRLGSPLLERLLHERLAAPRLPPWRSPAELPRPLPASVPTLLNAVRTGAVESAHAVARYLVARSASCCRPTSCAARSSPCASGSKTAPWCARSPCSPRIRSPWSRCGRMRRCMRSRRSQCGCGARGRR